MEPVRVLVPSCRWIFNYSPSFSQASIAFNFGFARNMELQIADLRYLPIPQLECGVMP